MALEQLCQHELWLGIGLADVIDEPAPLLPGLRWSQWLVAFATTQAVEVPIYLLALRGRPWAQRLWIAFMASTITHPLAWGLGLVLHPFLLHVIVAETLAVGVEALWLHRHAVPKALWWSLTANATSVAVFIGGRSLLYALTG